MRICIDLDGVVADFKRGDETYSDVRVISGAREKISALRASGHYIILYTARHMKTCSGNVGLAIGRVGLVTLEWLRRNHIEYDEIFFGKPWADIYIDDNAHRFVGWDSISPDGENLPDSSEKHAHREH